MIFDLKQEYQNYLQQVGLSEPSMHPVQIQETKRAFYGGCGQMFLLVSKTANLSEGDAIEVLSELERQISVFWAEQSINHLRSN